MTRGIAMLILVVASLAPALAAPRTITYSLQVLPSEQKVMKDPVTGSRLTFVAMSPWRDDNAYFHQRSFLSDDSAALYESFPAGRLKLMGFICATGERFAITTPRGDVSMETASRLHNRVFVLRGKDIVELSLKIRVSSSPTTSPSLVSCTERVVTTLGPGMSSDGYLSENSNGRLIGSGANLPEGGPGIITIDTRTGEVKVVCRIEPGHYHGHVQFSHVSPDLLSYAGDPRLIVVNTRTCESWAPYHELPGELVTHESWWVNDQIVFCGGVPTGESHVKVMNPKTGQVRIIGAGAWWPEGTPAQLAKWNWWHANGHDSGKWVVADNWYGDIMLFDGQTSRRRLVTTGHRTYGHGDHPHVGWDRSGKRVIFTSSMFGTPHVCIAEIPTP